MAMFQNDGGALLTRFAGETLRIEAWGENSLRVRARQHDDVREPLVSALIEPWPTTARVEIEASGEAASITNGRIRARVRLVVRHGADVRREPVISFTRADTGELLLEEARSHFASPAPRAYRHAASDSFHLEQTFASDPHLREKLRPYISAQITHYARTGDPLMRPLFYEFPDDARCWDVADAYMFGPDLLVAPILEPGARRRTVYLPAGVEWRDSLTGHRHVGGATVEVDAPLERIPYFIRAGRPDPAV